MKRSRPRKGRRLSAAPQSSSNLKSGETFIRVFDGGPIGLVIQSDHRVDEVIKMYQGDLAQILSGDCIVEINHKRVDPTLSGYQVSMQVVQSQRSRGRVRIRFYRPLTKQDHYMNKYHQAGKSDMSSRVGHKGKRGRGQRTSLVWNDADEGIGRTSGSNESVYEVHNLDLLVNEVETFCHHDDLSLLQCIERITECIPSEEREDNGDPLAYLDRDTKGIDRLFARIVDIIEKDPDESAIGRMLFFNLNPWLKMIHLLIDNVSNENLLYMISVTSLQHLLFIHSVATENLPATATASTLTYALLSPLFDIFTILLKTEMSKTVDEEKDEEDIYKIINNMNNDNDNDKDKDNKNNKDNDNKEDFNQQDVNEKDVETIEVLSPHLIKIGESWKSVIYVIMTRLTKFDQMNIPTITKFNTIELISLLTMKISIVDTIALQELSKRARVSMPGRPLGSVHGHQYEGSCLTLLFPTENEHVVINPLEVEETTTTTTAEHTSGANTNQGEIKFLVLHQDVLYVYPQLWRPYRGGSNVKGSQLARKYAVENTKTNSRGLTSSST
jgi:hypothetical protein